MYGSGLHFNSPGIVRVQKTFSATTVTGWDWTKVDLAFFDQNIITSLPLTGPSLIPFMCFVSGVNIDVDNASFLYIMYYGDSTLSAAAIISIQLLGTINDAFCSYPLENSNFNNAATVWPKVTDRTTNAGICIAADKNFVSGTSLTVTLYCVQSGLNY